MPFAATERTLPNGLKVVIVPTGFPNLVSIDIPVTTRTAPIRWRSSSRCSAIGSTRCTPTSTRRWGSSRTLRICPTSTSTRRRALASGAFSPIKYDGEKPATLLDEDKTVGVGALRLNLTADRVRITPIAEVFAR